jgi:hypothetical protein
MMPPGHIAATWGIAAVVQQHNPKLARLDYRLLALGALLPDIIDKPLAILVFIDAPTSQLVAHSLLFNLALLIAALFWWRVAVPYVLAFNAHLLADRMWHHTETFWWPIFGWRTFWEYKPMNTAEEMFNVYVDIIGRYPQVWALELLALLVLGWFIIRHRLYLWPRLKIFLATGRVWFAPSTSEPEPGQQNKTKIGLPASFHRE